ncbi:MAG: bacterial proteasome activator [Acidimicrobiales bacterium]|nr:MAG: bacterial proteasome activator [Acidimicrobiales bacterium]
MSDVGSDVHGKDQDRREETGHLRPDEVTDTPQGPSVDGEVVSQPGKVMRLGTMIKQLLDEVRSAELDEASRGRLREIYQRSVDELGEALSPDLREELSRLSFPFASELPTGAELRVAQAQLVGWLEGLFHGIQATLFAQQMAARQQLENMRAELPRQSDRERHGTYL